MPHPKYSRRAPCPKPVVSIHEHMAWYGDEGGFRPNRETEPTHERAGSANKIEVMRQRVERGECLFSDDDSEMDPEEA